MAGRADGRNTFGGQARVGRDKFGVGTDGSGSDHVHGAGEERWRKEAHFRFRTEFEQNSYADAKRMLKDFEQWLRQINESAAESLREALEEGLSLHRLEVPVLLRMTLHSTNPMESMFFMVGDCEGNLQRYRGSEMAQRWLGDVLLHCGQGFRRIKGYAAIKRVRAVIETQQAEGRKLKSAA